VDDVRDPSDFVRDLKHKPTRYKHKATQVHKIYLRSVARTSGEEYDARFTFQAPLEMDQDKEYFVALEAFVCEDKGGGKAQELVDRIVCVKTSLMTRNIIDVGDGGYGARTLAIFPGPNYTTTGMSPMNAGKLSAPWWQAPEIRIEITDIYGEHFTALDDNVDWSASLVFFSAPNED
jgi:hypothetical protein